MHFLYDFLPIILFFTVYKLGNIYAATAAAMIAAILQVLIFWIKHHQFEKMQLVTLTIITVLGSITLILHNPIFIQWKPTIVEWIFSITFLGSQFLCKKPIIQYMMEKKINLSTTIWTRLNIGWGTFFALMGLLNIYVVYHYSTNAWVNFKLFGVLGLTILFVVMQSIYLSRYVLNQKQ